MTDTVKIGRAWNGRLNHINDLLAWMFDENILNKGEKVKKDLIFRKYYRYYNDGDIPKGFKYESVAYTRTHIETQVNEFIATILTKYKGKYSRADFRKSMRNQQLGQLARQAEQGDFHSLFTYFGTEYKIAGVPTYKYFNMGALHLMYSKVSDEVNALIATLDQSDKESWNQINPGHVLTHRINGLEDMGAMTHNINKKMCALAVYGQKLANEIRREIR